MRKLPRGSGSMVQEKAIGSQLERFDEIIQQQAGNISARLVKSMRGTLSIADRASYDISIAARKTTEAIERALETQAQQGIKVTSERGQYLLGRSIELTEKMLDADVKEAKAIFASLKLIREQTKTLASTEQEAVKNIADMAIGGTREVASKSLLKASILENIPRLEDFTEKILGGGFIGKTASSFIRLRKEKKQREIVEKASAQRLGTDVTSDGADITSDGDESADSMLGITVPKLDFANKKSRVKSKQATSREEEEEKKRQAELIPEKLDEIIGILKDSFIFKKKDGEDGKEEKQSLLQTLLGLKVFSVLLNGLKSFLSKAVALVAAIAGKLGLGRLIKSPKPSAKPSTKTTGPLGTPSQKAETKVIPPTTAGDVEPTTPKKKNILGKAWGGVKSAARATVGAGKAAARATKKAVRKTVEYAKKFPLKSLKKHAGKIFGSVAKKLPVIGPLLSLGSFALNANEIKSSDMSEKEKKKALGSLAAKTLGMGIGSSVGAGLLGAIGLVGGPAAALTAIAGAVGGGWLGEKLGGVLASAIGEEKIYDVLRKTPLLGGYLDVSSPEQQPVVNNENMAANQGLEIAPAQAAMNLETDQVGKSIGEGLNATKVPSVQPNTSNQVNAARINLTDQKENKQSAQLSSMMTALSTSYTNAVTQVISGPIKTRNDHNTLERFESAGVAFA